MDWYKLERQDLIEKLGTREAGLTDEEVSDRITRVGANLTVEERRTGTLTILLRQFRSVIIYILLAAAVVSLLIGDVKEFYVIAGIVGFIVLLSFFEEYKATRDIESLKRLTPLMARVRREREQRINARGLVPGDIILLRSGDIVPADARIIELANLQVDESALTGESVPVEKDVHTLLDTVSLADRRNMVFAGSLVTSGNGVAVVVETGKRTEIGRIASLVQETPAEQSPLQKRLDTLGTKFGYIVVSVCVLIFVIGLLRGGGAEQLLVLAIAVAVAGIPESLPAVISVSLAIGMKRMARKNAIIKRLSAVETLGTCTYICSDKTGTLTQNKMVVELLWSPAREVRVTGEGFDRNGEFFVKGRRIDPLNDHCLELLLRTSVLCNDSTLTEQGISGEKTEGALLILGEKAGLTKEALLQASPRLAEQAFSSDRKLMSAVHGGEKHRVLYAKGAPERILERATHYYTGSTQKLTANVRASILERNDALARDGYRVLALAYRDFTEQVAEEYDEHGLSFIGLVAIRDPPEPSAFPAIRDCHDAGIRTVMITGDSPLTAEAIAKELGMLLPGQRVLTGEEMDAMDDHTFHHVIPSVAVFARVAPNHKLRIVKTLQDRGEIVAMTGDGVNDAPALRKADIGIAMGREGTDVAREASEMILKDDNFATIVHAVEEGRNIYSNILRFLYYLLPGNFSQISIILIATLAGVLPPLTPLMILFINLVTSDFPALGLAVEKSSKNLMKQRPRDPQEQVLSSYLLLKIGQVIPIIVLGTVGLYMWEFAVLGVSIETARTVAFVAIIMFMLFHGFNAKALNESVFSRSMLSNIFFYAGFSLSLIATMIVLYVPAAAAIFGTVPLTFPQWIPIIVITSIVVVYMEIQKTIIASELRESQRLDMHPTRH